MRHQDEQATTANVIRLPLPMGRSRKSPRPAPPPTSWILHGRRFSVRGRLCLEGRLSTGEPTDILFMADVLGRFGLVEPSACAASWTWRDDADGADVSEDAIAGAELVSTTGLRVPLSLVPKLFGLAVGAEMLVALGAMPSRTATAPAEKRAAPYETKAMLDDYAKARQARGRADGTIDFIRKHSKALLRLLPAHVSDITHAVLLAYISARRAEGSASRSPREDS